MLILGYAGINVTLRKDHIFTGRTCRLNTALQKGTEYLEGLFLKNLEDLLKILQWNYKNKIKFYRIGSDMAPHITNPVLIKNKNDFTQLAYSLDKYKPILANIGKYAQDHNIRLTFHPDLFNVLNSPNPQVVLKTYRDLYYHNKLLDLMNLDSDSVIILHGGGVYDNKILSMKRWITNFNKLPENIKARIVIENDETSYNFKDVYQISQKVKPFEIIGAKSSNLYNKKIKVKIPVVFDIFHYYCYNKYKKTSKIKTDSITQILKLAYKTWIGRTIKIHLSEQLIDKNKYIPMGSHADFINNIPEELLKFAKTKKIYLMCECKMKELCLFKLREKL